MENQTDESSVSLAVASFSNNPVTPHPRFAQYKARNNIPNQQERRKRILEDQKQKRSESFNVSRGLIEELCTSAEEYVMEWRGIKAKPRQNKVYKNRLMMSEWLVHIPEDMAHLWYLVPCPVGRRSLIVAVEGNTRAFSKNGLQMAKFKSALPGGNHDDFRGCTILDCIWSLKNHCYYVLDVLAWSNQPMIDCETEFRFYWLQSKIEEISCLSTSSENNLYAFFFLPYHQCDTSVMKNVMAREKHFGHDGPALDGLLFYHSQAHYISGHTPLVGWLKPHMMQTVLGIPVASMYLEEEMKRDKRKQRKFRKKCSKLQKDASANDSVTEMDTNALDETGDSHNESLTEDMEPQDSSLN